MKANGYGYGYSLMKKIATGIIDLLFGSGNNSAQYGSGANTKKFGG